MANTRVRIGINGAGGRIGKLVLRRCLDDPDVEVVLLNDLMSAQQIHSSLIRDSVHGWYDGEVNVSVDSDGRAYIVVPRKLHPGGVLLGTEQSYSIAVFNERDPAKLRLDGVDVMIEATGAFTRRQQLEVYRGAGAERVILTAPASTDEDVDLTVVLGVNDHQYDSSKHFLLSNASCTTNCLAPVLQVLDEHFGVVKADMLTVHARTNDQRVVDGTHKDPRRARDAGLNIIPTTTGAAKAVGLVIPKLAGLVSGISDRVPVAHVSQIFLVCLLKKNTTTEEVNRRFSEVAQARLRGIIEYTEEPLVSSDVIGNPHSAVVDADFTLVSGKLARVVAWYDNEWAYSCRVVDLAKRISG